MTLAFALWLVAGTKQSSADESQLPPQTKTSKKRIGRLPFLVVKLLPKTGQALVYYQDLRAHVVIAEGDLIGGFAVVEIEDDHVVVSRDGRELVLAADPRAPQPGPGSISAARDSSTPALRGPQPIDPYAHGPRHEVPVPTEPTVPTVPTDALSGKTMSLERAELEAALSDFTRLNKEVGFVRVARGVKLSKVPAGSYFWTVGLRAGDVVTAIDGTPLRALDDAAAAYSRLGSTRQLAVDVDRGAARGTLRFIFK